MGKTAANLNTGKLAVTTTPTKLVGTLPQKPTTPVIKDNIAINAQQKTDMNSPSSKKNPYLKKDTLQAGKGIVPSPAKQPAKTEKAKASVKVPTRKTVTEKPQ